MFTTEINDAPEKNTNLADKSNLNERKNIFKNSKFVQNFPVIILACSDYIKNNSDVREIDEIFNVKYSDNKIFTKNNWFFLHYNNEKTKLVIHTRQLSANVKPELLIEMGEIIQKHLISLGLINTSKIKLRKTLKTHCGVILPYHTELHFSDEGVTYYKGIQIKRNSIPAIALESELQ